jgi:hypothetical protein
MKNKFIYTVIAIAFIVLSALSMQGCSSKKNEDKIVSETEAFYNAEKKDAKTTSTPTEAGAMDKDESKRKGESTANSNENDQVAKDVISQDNQIAEKIPTKIIKQADVSFQVKNMEDSRKAILTKVKKSGGYISSENQTNNSYQIENTMVIRIKSGGFDDLVDQLLKQSIYTESKKITADDVTEEYVDAVARLKSKKEVEKQYEEILKKAYSIYDILQVEQQLRMIREEIEAYEGKIKYLDDRVDYSTISLHFYEKLDYVAAPSNDSGFFYKMGKAFSGGWHIVLALFIGLAYLWPIILAMIIGLLFLLRYLRRSRNKKVK